MRAHHDLIAAQRLGKAGDGLGGLADFLVAGVFRTSRIQEFPGTAGQPFAFLPVKTGDLVVAGKSTDVMRKGGLNVDQMDVEAVRMRVARSF